MSTRSQLHVPGAPVTGSPSDGSAAFFVSAEGQFLFSGSLDPVSMTGGSPSVFDAHWIFENAGDAAGMDGEGATLPAFYAPDVSIDVTASAGPGGVPDVGGDDNGGSLTVHGGGLDAGVLTPDFDGMNFADRPDHGLAGVGWQGAAYEGGSPSWQVVDFGADSFPAGTSAAPDVFAGLADARGGGGSQPGGGGGGTNGGGGGNGGGNGGGGGGSSLPTTYTTGDLSVSDANEFNIHIEFGGSWTAQQQAVVTWAADLWTSIITGDVRDDIDLNGNPVDDITIEMSIGRIDGSGNPLFGNVLAQTQIFAVRDPGSVDEWLPVTSSITLDSTDLKNSVKEGWSGTWDSIIAHEMGHALGFAGLIFDNLDLVDSFGNFTGANAVAAYGAGEVPLEQDGGAGTAGSHWDENTFMVDGKIASNELMTGYIVLNEQTWLSDTTVAAMADLGYQVQDPSVGSSYLTIDNHLLLA